MSMPPDWHHAPPTDQNGWGRYVAATLASHGVRLQFLESRFSDLMQSSRPASNAPTTDEPSKKPALADYKDIVKEVATSLKWLAAIILLLALIFKKLDPQHLPALKPLLGMSA